MFLFINTIPENSVYILFDSERKEKKRKNIAIKGMESELFLVSLEQFLKENDISFSEIEGMVVVNGPGGFTGMRIITLTINTIAFVYGTKLYPIDFFALGELSGYRYPIILKANRGEYLVKNSREDIPHIIAITELPIGEYSGIGDENDFANREIFIQSKMSCNLAILNLDISNSVRRIDPLYIKKPNITKKIP